MAELHRYAARARAALAAQPAPEPVPPQDGPELGAIFQQQLDQLQQAMLAPPSRSHPIRRSRNPPLPTQTDLEQASGQVLRLYQDGGGKLRRHQEAQEQADIAQEVQTHPEPGPEPVQAQEDRQDGQNVDGGAAGSTAAAVPGNEALAQCLRPENTGGEGQMQPECSQAPDVQPKQFQEDPGPDTGPGQTGAGGTGGHAELVTGCDHPETQKPRTLRRTRKNR